MAFNILLLSDGRPGHFHLSEGVIKAISRQRPTQTNRLEIKKRRFLPNKLMRLALKAKYISPENLLAWGYGISAKTLPPADLIVSAGGKTILANIAAARFLGAPNIFCGSLRGVDPHLISLTITSFERFGHLPNHLVTLKPNLIDPDAFERPKSTATFDNTSPPQTAGLVIGGDSGLFKYNDNDWNALLGFAKKLSKAWGTRWIISNSPRTSPTATRMIEELAKDKSIVENFIDYRSAGPGSLAPLFERSQIIVCTEDSSTMISEAICARTPVIGVSPKQYRFEDREKEYRDYLLSKNWCRTLPISNLTIESFSNALEAIRPLKENHLDILADSLKERLPALFEK